MWPPRPRTLPVLLTTTLLLAPVGLPGTVQTAFAQSDTKRWTPELTMRYDQIPDTEISPDGEHVAYVVREAVTATETSTFRQHIHVVATDGSFDVQYTRGEHSNWSPRWSPDGERLAFLSSRTERPQVHVIRLNGGEAYPVTEAETGVNSFRWGPDGDRIAYTMTDPKTEAEEEREREKRDVHRVNQELRYSHLYVIRVRSGEETIPEATRLTAGSFYVINFDWSPDGETVAFGHQPTPRIDDYLERDISTVPADSGIVSSLVEWPGADADPRYGPEGRTVAFISQGGPPEPGPGLRSDVYTVPAGGGSPTALSSTPNQRASLVGWAEGTEAVLVSDLSGTARHVYSVPVDGDTVRQITGGQGVYQAPSYAPSSDQLAVTYQSSTEPAEVYLGPRRDFDRRMLTSVHADLPRPEMGRTELISWRGGEGEEVESLLTYPVGYDGGPVPLVLAVHGGPASAHLRTFTGARGHFPPQVFAQHGYAVLRPNPRGSDGYGLAFREAAIGNWGAGPFQDLMAGVEETIEMGVAHPDSLAIMGGSYGGYMTAWAVTRTDRFEAASMVAGISNLISMVGTTDVPVGLSIYYGGEFWNRTGLYEEQSALFHVQDVTTPTQVLHGAEDERVPPSQGREFYRALKRRGVPAEFVLYPRTPHGAEEPKLMMDFAPRVIDWFDEHLGRASSDS